MIEVEVKVPADHETVQERLAALGATQLGTVRQVDTYFDAPHRDFAASDEALRLRREVPTDGDARHLVTYKGPLMDEASKSREEAETSVGDAAAMREVLAGLGFEPAATVEKDRDRYEVDDFTVTLDAVDGLGEFVEVERAAAEVETAREGAFEVLRDLGLDPADQIRTSYLGLLLGVDGPDEG